MPVVAKMIFRLDFEVSTDFLDRPGTAVRLMNYEEHGKKVWDSVQLEASRSRIRAEKRSADEYRTFTFDPITINGEIEDAKGVELKSLRESDGFRSFNKVTADYCKSFNVGNVTRSGLRLVCLDFLPKEAKNMLIWNDSTKSKIVSEALGEIKDSGSVFEGMIDSGLSYRLACGPVSKSDQGRVLTNLDEKVSLSFLENYNFIFDLDLYERNFSFREHNLYRWSATKVEKAIAFIDSVRKVAKAREAN